METKKTPRLAVIEIAAIVLLAGLVVWGVASRFEPLSEGERAKILLDGTQDLPQDRAKASPPTPGLQ